MSYECIRIEREKDGFEVRVTDPEIAKRNRDEDAPYEDPDVEYTFETIDQVCDFIKEVADTALPKSEYSTAFEAAAKKATNE